MDNPAVYIWLKLFQKPIDFFAIKIVWFIFFLIGNFYTIRSCKVSFTNHFFNILNHITTICDGGVTECICNFLRTEQCVHLYSVGFWGASLLYVNHIPGIRICVQSNVQFLSGRIQPALKKTHSNVAFAKIWIVAIGNKSSKLLVEIVFGKIIECSFGFKKLAWVYFSLNFGVDLAKIFAFVRVAF